MALSLGRRLYNLSARRLTGREPISQQRPEGRLVWLHSPGGSASEGMMQTARRLIAEQDIRVLLTYASAQAEGPLAADSSGQANWSGAVGLTGAAGHGQSLIHSAPPQDVASQAEAFLDHWKPAVIVIADGEVRPALFHAAAERGVPLLIVDGRQPYLALGRDGWFPGLMRGALATVRQVFAMDEAAGRAFRAAGAPEVRVLGRMEERSSALPYHEGERAMMASMVATRPIWLAASVPEAEEAAVIAAHRSALRLAHRLLLILVPEQPERAAVLAQRLEEDEGWSVAQRGLEQEPVAENEVYLPDGSSEFGLWYRLAPVTFLGGSLFGTGALRSPMEPAALGSAIIHGPHTGAFGAAFGRLGAARATRAVASPADLAEALSDLQSADRTARLAHAAWAVSSDGADVTQELLAQIGLLVGPPSTAEAAQGKPGSGDGGRR